jgi:hypothetical protein
MHLVYHKYSNYVTTIILISLLHSFLGQLFLILHC